MQGELPNGLSIFFFGVGGAEFRIAARRRKMYDPFGVPRQRPTWWETLPLGCYHDKYSAVNLNRAVNVR